MTTDQHEQSDARRIVLRLNGVATIFDGSLAGDGFVRDLDGSWRPFRDNSSYAVEEQCIRLHDELAAKIFGSLAYYYVLLPTTPNFLSTAGLNSEAPLGREEFGQLLHEFANFPELNRFLYLYDCRMLVSAIQECTKEVSQLVGEFYRILNLEPFFTRGIAVDDGIRWSTSPIVTNLYATLGFLFIRLHSLLDYLTKLAWEAEKLPTDFTTYPKLKSVNILFGQRNKLRVNQRIGSLFEVCEEVKEVELVRNLLIHDGLLDDMPKAYEVIESGVAVERFILMPDRKDGQFEKFKNRKLFYGREDKINLRLAGLVHAFKLRESETLKGIRLGLDPSVDV